LETQIQSFLASLATQPKYSASTCSAYASDLRIFFDHLVKTLKRTPIVGDFNTLSLKQFFEAEKNEGRQLSTLLRRRAALQSFEKYLMAEGILKEGQFKDDQEMLARIMPGHSGKYLPIYLPADSVSSLFSLMEDSPRPLVKRDRALFSLLVEMGLSVSTLISVNLNDLDLRAGKIHLTGALGEDYWLPLGTAANPIECYVKEGRPELHPSPNEPALFVSQNGVRMSRQSVWQILKHWGKLANLDTALSPRVLRHTAALRLLRSGRPVSEIQVLMGHRNPLSTQALLTRLESEPHLNR
jgi:integrase/recombinase XerD